MGHHHYSARRHPEFVVLEIGDGIGALIIHASAGMHGAEIEISPAGDDSRRRHKEVLERSTGEYTLWVRGEVRARGVSIAGGTIAELDWRPVLAAP